MCTRFKKINKNNVWRTGRRRRNGSQTVERSFRYAARKKGKSGIVFGNRTDTERERERKTFDVYPLDIYTRGSEQNKKESEWGLGCGAGPRPQIDAFFDK